jgi:hypothetical protein
MSAARIALALALAFGALIGGARAGGAFAPVSRGGPDQGAGTPSREGELSVGDGLEVSGQPMQLSLFYTQDSPRRVIQFHADAFRARGLLPVLAGDHELAHVSVFDPGTGLQRFVSAVPQPDGLTLVLSGATNPRRPPRFLRGAAEGASFPVPSGHRAFLGFRSADAGSRAESAQFVSAQPVHEVEGFYRQALAAQGFSEKHDPSGGGLMIFSRPDATVSVALQKLDENRGAAVFVTRLDGPPR